MADAMAIANILVDRIKRTYKDDIALVAYYGSYAQGKATSLSDLDMFFIPCTEKGFEASFQFILDGVGYDLFPISWERAERMASFDEFTASIIADARILYVKSDEDLWRFQQLKEKISSMSEMGNKRTMVEKSLTKLNECYAHLYKLNQTDSSNNLAAIQYEAYGLLTKTFESLALVNQTYLKRGWGASLEQINSFIVKPENIEGLVQRIIREHSCEKIIEACEELFYKVRICLIDEQKVISEIPAFASLFNGFYEEEKSIFNKVISACDRDDYEGAYFATLHVQDVLMNFLTFAKTGVWCSNLHRYDMLSSEYKRLGLPELNSLLQSGNLKLLKKTIMELDQLFKGFLEANGVKLKIFDQLEAFQKYVVNMNFNS